MLLKNKYYLKHLELLKKFRTPKKILFTLQMEGKNGCGDL